jgi:hypothetical protein
MRHCRICDAITDPPRKQWHAICPECERAEARVEDRAARVAPMMHALAQHLLDHPRSIVNGYQYGGAEHTVQRLMRWTESVQQTMFYTLREWQAATDDIHARSAQGRRSRLARGVIQACPWCGEPESSLSGRHWCEACEANACDECSEEPAPAGSVICASCEAAAARRKQPELAPADENEHRRADNLERGRDFRAAEAAERMGRDAA